MRKKAHTSPFISSVGRQSGCRDVLRANIGLNTDETRARVLATLKAAIYSTEDPGTITVTQ